MEDGKMKRTHSKGLLWLGTFLLILLGCSESNQENTILETPYEGSEFLMGTYVTLRVYDEGKEEVLEEAFARIAELSDKITTNEPGSEMEEVNQAAGQEAVVVSDDVFPLVETAAEYSALPNSGFDYTIGPITDLWRIGFDDARVPEPEEIEAVLPLVDYSKVELNAEDRSIYLQEESMRIDLGAIAKGYIADEVAKLFSDAGVTTAILDLGGNIVVMGDSPTRDTGGFNVGVQDPFDLRGSYIGAINLQDKSIVTSGIYERYIEQEGELYHHLMDPKTGYPFDNSLASVTIISDLSVDGDALSTVAFGYGLEDGLNYLNDLEDVEGVFITKDRDVYLTDGLTDNFSLTNDEYTLIE